ncbi:MAG: thioredoxin family protein [Pseudomonadota bacterium]
MKIVRTLIALFAFAAASAHALDIAPYTPAAVSQAQQENRPYVLHFHADWCPVCRKQTEVLDTLKADPALKLTVFVVNYDKERPLRRQHGVRMQSTLIAFRGKAETDRIVGITDPDIIRDTLASAL